MHYIHSVFMLWVFEIDFLLQFRCGNTYSTTSVLYIIHRVIYSIHYHPSLSNQNCIGWKHAYSSKYSEDSPSGWAQHRVINPLHDITTRCYTYEKYSKLSNGILDVFYLKKKYIKLPSALSVFCNMPKSRPKCTPYTHNGSRIHINICGTSVYLKLL